MAPKNKRQGKSHETDRTWLSESEISSIQTGLDSGLQPVSPEKRSILGQLAKKFGMIPAWEKGPEGKSGVEKD